MQWSASAAMVVTVASAARYFVPAPIAVAALAAPGPGMVSYREPWAPAGLAARVSCAPAGMPRFPAVAVAAAAAVAASRFARGPPSMRVAEASEEAAQAKIPEFSGSNGGTGDAAAVIRETRTPAETWEAAQLLHSHQSYKVKVMQIEGNLR